MITEHMTFLNTFYYACEIIVTSENYKTRILNFDKKFLELGEKHGLFFYRNNEKIQQYISRRKVKFLTNKRPWISLLDLDQFEDTSILNMYMNLPNPKGELVITAYHQNQHKLKCLEIDNSDFFDFHELNKLSFWEKKISISIMSSSNIWCEYIDLSLDQNNNLTSFNPPLNNRFISYRITPIFNSFLRDVKRLVKEFNGNLILDDCDKRYVTQEGILLDGKIIYQEDIDEGRVKLPEK